MERLEAKLSAMLSHDAVGSKSQKAADRVESMYGPSAGRLKHLEARLSAAVERSAFSRRRHAELDASGRQAPLQLRTQLLSGTQSSHDGAAVHAAEQGAEGDVHGWRDRNKYEYKYEYKYEDTYDGTTTRGRGRAGPQRDPEATNDLEIGGARPI